MDREDCERYKGWSIVSISESRWDVHITIERQEHCDTGIEVKETQTLVASADSFYTDRDGIWFGTKKEHDAY